jgi:uncharacterized damage-inducible protein DinB
MTTERIDPDMLAPERLMLDTWLEYHRATLVMKCDGLTDEQLRRRSVPPSSMSLLGLVRHMADVERHWFRDRIAGEDAPSYFWSDAHPDGDFDLVDDAPVAAAFATFAEECARSRIVAARLDLDATGSTNGDPRGASVSLRWVLVHMIEEYARHNGHADLLRECVDGTVGD